MAKAESKVEPIIIIGIDSSTSCTGISVISKTGKKEKLLDYKKIITEKVSYENKVIYIYSEIIAMYRKYEDNNPVVAIELLNSSIGMNVTRLLAGLWGYIKITFYKETGKNIASINTKKIKKIVTGNGNCDKYSMVKYMNSYFKIKLNFHKTNKSITDDDIADSMAVAIAVSRLLDKGENIEQYF